MHFVDDSVFQTPTVRGALFRMCEWRRSAKCAARWEKNPRRDITCRIRISIPCNTLQEIWYASNWAIPWAKHRRMVGVLLCKPIFAKHAIQLGEDTGVRRCGVTLTPPLQMLCNGVRESPHAPCGCYMQHAGNRMHACQEMLWVHYHGGLYVKELQSSRWARAGGRPSDSANISHSNDTSTAI